MKLKRNGLISVSNKLFIAIKRSKMLIAFVASLVIIYTVCVFFELRWNTNDDVAMSMFAHGYGVSSYGTPNLLFSNVIWGHFVRSLPEINGVLGYSTATLSVLLIISTCIFYVLLEFNAGLLVSVAIFGLILLRPILFPQFTINAGLLTVCAIVCWYIFGLQGERRVFFAGLFLAYCGYLIRSKEFLLVLLVALPLLPWRRLIEDRVSRFAVPIFLLTIGMSSLVDYRSYQNNDWQLFLALNKTAGSIADFGTGLLLKQRPDVLSRNGYTENDISLIESTTWDDPKIWNPATLGEMLAELGPVPAPVSALANGFVGIKALADPILLPNLLVAFVLLLMRPSKRSLAVWGLCIAALFLLGLLGRPGQLRVYIPVVSLLLVSSLLENGIGKLALPNNACRFARFIMFVAATWSIVVLFTESKAFQMASEQIRLDLQDFPNSSVVIWGGRFPYESVYPVTRISRRVMAYELCGLGSSTFAPFSRPAAILNSGQHLVDRLASEDGIQIVAGSRELYLLSIYCREHWGGVLHEVNSRQYGDLSVKQVKCEIRSKE